MRQRKMLMGMPISVEIVDPSVTEEIFNQVFNYFDYVDKKFSTYKYESEISRINRREIAVSDYSDDMKEVFLLCEDTKIKTNGYFNIQNKDGVIDPSGLVKGWAIYKAAGILTSSGYKNFYVEAGGDVQVSGKNSQGEFWKIGIRHPFKQEEIVKIVQMSHGGVATSGTYIRGQHIYDPHNPQAEIVEISSLTVIADNIYEADRFATAAYAMGKKGINFIERMPGLEGYMIDPSGIATVTSGFNNYVK